VLRTFLGAGAADTRLQDQLDRLSRRPAHPPVPAAD
jgi:hypothetical protein